MLASANDAARRRSGSPSRAAALALCALLLGAAPAAPQQTPPEVDAAGKRLLGVRADSAQLAAEAEAARSQPAGSGAFWRRLRDEARRFREASSGPFHFALRYRISLELAHTIHDAARAEGIDPELAFRLVKAESGFNPRARSRAGALGLAQLMPRTARWLDRGMTTSERVMDPRANLHAGFRYLRGLIRKYRGDLRLALLAYNRGDGAVDRDLRRGRDPENGYTRRVLGQGLDRYRGSGLAER
ncbi:MAG TPA: lytic transglycosylase domain-containing protein [Longimicrobiaceae bacterium]|nr:lytic transglycosylase domain-containing protein [Longimicrobiaceae bacterium]